jgi:hypothetical protein
MPQNIALGANMHPAFNKVSFQLKTGRKVSVESAHIQETYGGLLEGYPTEELNLETLENAKSMMRGCWGPRPTHIIPATLLLEHGAEFLPPWLCMVWLTSLTPIDKDSMGSELVVIWFVPDACSVPLLQLISTAVMELDWESLASDFDL